jgi:hypothetical protein
VRHGKGKRLLAGLILLMFSAPLSTRGLCFMPAIPMPGSASGAEHDCCKQGLQALPPACCMTSLAVEAPARIAKAFQPFAPALVAAALEPLPVSAALQHRRLLRSRGDAHLADSPPVVMRV